MERFKQNINVEMSRASADSIANMIRPHGAPWHHHERCAAPSLRSSTCPCTQRFKAQELRVVE
eukprot:5748574-Pyramimonas_sp.AAC.1